MASRLIERRDAAIVSADDPVQRECLKAERAGALARHGLIMELAPDRFFLRDAAIARAVEAHALSAGLSAGGFTAAQFRDRLGNGRQLAIQVLDYFDRRGITVRRGDLRRAGKDPAGVFGSPHASNQGE